MFLGSVRALVLAFRGLIFDLADREAPTPAPTPTPTQLPIGSEVELHGLKTALLNGRVGTVLGYPAWAHVFDP